jgi:1-acyl-sn-glycerol-3-phosphate acyltransferase
MISIEGRRSATGTLSPYKKGAAILALNTNAIIVPYVTLGTKELWDSLASNRVPKQSVRTELGGEVLWMVSDLYVVLRLVLRWCYFRK